MSTDSSYSLTTLSQSDTQNFGESFADSLRDGDVILLNGNLGAGKTALTRGIVKSLHGTSDSVKSPSYTLLNIYDGKPEVYHFDFYRIEEDADIIELGLSDYFGKGVSVVEWPKNFCRSIEGRKIEITIRDAGENKREIEVNRDKNV